MDFQSLITALQTGTIQMAVAGMTITPQRAQVVYFSKPYYHSGQSILVKKGSPIKDLAECLKKQAKFTYIFLEAYLCLLRFFIFTSHSQ